MKLGTLGEAFTKNARRYVVICLSHTDKTKFKTYKELEEGDTYAGWSDNPPNIGNNFNLRFSKSFDVGNFISMGRVVKTFHYHPTRHHSQLVLPFTLLPRLRFTDEDKDKFNIGDTIVMTENALLIVREVRKCQ